MTNGEKFKEVFKDTIADVGYDGLTNITKVSIFHNHYVLYFLKGWWNAEYKEPTPKNDLGVDLISRAEVLKLIYDYKENHSENRKEYPINYGTLIDMIRWVRNLPSVTPQESFINKPCVSEKACEHDKNVVLDKIRAEIERGKIGLDIEFNGGIDYALSIIDKYKKKARTNNDKINTRRT